jgi:hypothetical protein
MKMMNFLCFVLLGVSLSSSVVIMNGDSEGWVNVINMMTR